MNFNQKWYSRNNKKFEKIENIKHIIELIFLISFCVVAPLIALMLFSDYNQFEKYDYKKFIREYIKPLEIFNQE